MSALPSDSSGVLTQPLSHNMTSEEQEGLTFLPFKQNIVIRSYVFC